jgi:hypothetical protein
MSLLRLTTVVSFGYPDRVKAQLVGQGNLLKEFCEDYRLSGHAVRAWRLRQTAEQIEDQLNSFSIVTRQRSGSSAAGPGGAGGSEHGFQVELPRFLPAG